MTTDNCISEPISSFGFNSQMVQPSSQLIALQEAIESLLVRIDALERENMALKGKLEGLERDHNKFSENQFIQLRLINELRKSKETSIGKTFQERAEKLNRYMESRPDHKATYETLRGFLGVDARIFNLVIEALVALYPERYEYRKDGNDKRRKWLVLLPRI